MICLTKDFDPCPDGEGWRLVTGRKFPEVGVSSLPQTPFSGSNHSLLFSVKYSGLSQMFREHGRGRYKESKTVRNHQGKQTMVETALRA